MRARRVRPRPAREAPFRDGRLREELSRVPRLRGAETEGRLNGQCGRAWPAARGIHFAPLAKSQPSCPDSLSRVFERIRSRSRLVPLCEHEGHAVELLDVHFLPGKRKWHPESNADASVRQGISVSCCAARRAARPCAGCQPLAACRRCKERQERTRQGGQAGVGGRRVLPRWRKKRDMGARTEQRAALRTSRGSSAARDDQRTRSAPPTGQWTEGEGEEGRKHTACRHERRGGREKHAVAAVEA